MTYGEVQTLFPVADAAFLASYEWHHADGRLTGAVLRQSAGIRRWDLFTVEDPEPALGAIRLIDLSRSDWDHRVTSCMWTRLSDSERVSVGCEEGSTPADSFLEDLEHARLTDQPNSGAAGQNCRAFITTQGSEDGSICLDTRGIPTSVSFDSGVAMTLRASCKGELDISLPFVLPEIPGPDAFESSGTMADLKIPTNIATLCEDPS